jgi:hypothetical protein
LIADTLLTPHACFMQSRATDAARGGAEATLKQQLEAVHREADLRVQMLTKQ